MRQFLKKVWRDERGCTTPEWAFIATILVLGAITGLVASRQATVAAVDDPPPARIR